MQSWTGLHFLVLFAKCHCKNIDHCTFFLDQVPNQTISPTYMEPPKASTNYFFSRLTACFFLSIYNFKYSLLTKIVPASCVRFVCVSYRQAGSVSISSWIAMLKWYMLKNKVVFCEITIYGDKCWHNSSIVLTVLNSDDCTELGVSKDIVGNFDLGPHWWVNLTTSISQVTLLCQTYEIMLL